MYMRKEWKTLDDNARNDFGRGKVFYFVLGAIIGISMSFLVFSSYSSTISLFKLGLAMGILAVLSGMYFLIVAYSIKFIGAIRSFFWYQMARAVNTFLGFRASSKSIHTQQMQYLPSVRALMALGSCAAFLVESAVLIFVGLLLRSN